MFAQSSRLAVAAEFRAVETTFATYTVTATEAGREWRHPVRWSDLRRLHDELQQAFGEALKKQDIPTFRPHTLRLGSARLSPSFCAARASEMQSYLSALVEALGVSLVDGTGPAVLRAFLAQGCDVEQPTPIDRWYTPEAGWPGVAWAGEERLAPCSLTPTGLAATALPDEILGELRVEILQATGLERSDLYSQNDVYARSSCTAQRSLALSLALSLSLVRTRTRTYAYTNAPQPCTAHHAPRSAITHIHTHQARTHAPGMLSSCTSELAPRRLCSRTRTTLAGNLKTAALLASPSPRPTPPCTWPSSMLTSLR